MKSSSLADSAMEGAYLKGGMKVQILLIMIAVSVQEHYVKADVAAGYPSSSLTLLLRSDSGSLGAPALTQPRSLPERDTLKCQPKYATIGC